MLIYKKCAQICILICCTALILSVVVKLLPQICLQNNTICINEVLYDISIGISASTVVAFVTIYWIDVLIKKQELKEQKEKEKCAILRYHKLLSVVIIKYRIYYNQITSPIELYTNKNIKDVNTKEFNSHFNICDLKDMGFAAGRMDSEILDKSISKFIEYEDEIKNNAIAMLRGIDFNYYPEISDILIKIVDCIDLGMGKTVLSYFSHEVNPKLTKTFIDVIAQTTTNTIENFENRNISRNIYVPIVVFYNYLQEKRELINLYLKEIEEISND